MDIASEKFDHLFYFHLGTLNLFKIIHENLGYGGKL